jgi:transcriptional regulator with XRE-family HTH domain
MMTIQDRLRQLRFLRKLTQAEVGEAVGVVGNSISNYEQGRSVPDADMLSRLADFFQVSVDYLLGRTDIPQPYLRENPMEQMSKLIEEGTRRAMTAAEETASKAVQETIRRAFTSALGGFGAPSEGRVDQPPMAAGPPAPSDDTPETSPPGLVAEAPPDAAPLDVDELGIDRLAASMEAEYGRQPSPELVDFIRQTVLEVREKYDEAVRKGLWPPPRHQAKPG